ncbi:hypothetical protein DESC_260007 [Desulfosarcina cetonica]|nr:hypothetical protein DESC_260007 [Desulfosarcina cetonica]
MKSSHLAIRNFNDSDMLEYELEHLSISISMRTFWLPHKATCPTYYYPRPLGRNGPERFRLQPFGYSGIQCQWVVQE